jgi:hypothetical protein
MSSDKTKHQQNSTNQNSNNQQLEETSKCNEEAIKENYGESFHSHLLEQYKMYVEMMDRVTDRRGKTNTFYISLLSSLLALFSLLFNKNSLPETNDILSLLISFLGLSLCCIWWTNINSYKQLNSLKFKVIYEIEKQLPFSCYSKEWEFDKNKIGQYRRLSKVEKYIPVVIAIPYIGLLIYALFSFLK